jgi:hypothetical protein
MITEALKEKNPSHKTGGLIGLPKRIACGLERECCKEMSEGTLSICALPNKYGSKKGL